MSDQATPNKTNFNPADHLDTVSGKPFLPAKWRIYWLRLDAPDSKIESEALELSHEHAVFRAHVIRIKDGAIAGEATAHARETIDGFADYIEKAETSAISRALAMLGYGSELSEDFAESRQAPQQSRQNGRQQAKPARMAPDTARPAPASPRPPQAQHDESGNATEAQLAAIDNLAGKLGLISDDVILDAAQAVLTNGIPASVANLTASDAGKVIRELQRLEKRNRE